MKDRSINPALRSEVVRLVCDEGRAIGQVAAEQGLAPAALAVWVKRAQRQAALRERFPKARSRLPRVKVSRRRRGAAEQGPVFLELKGDRVVFRSHGGQREATSSSSQVLWCRTPIAGVEARLTVNFGQGSLRVFDVLTEASYSLDNWPRGAIAFGLDGVHVYGQKLVRTRSGAVQRERMVFDVGAWRCVDAPQPTHRDEVLFLGEIATEEMKKLSPALHGSDGSACALIDGVVLPRFQYQHR